MHCSTVKEHMKGFLEDLVGEKTDQEIREHLGRCSGCSWYAESTGSLSYRLREMALIEIPRDLMDYVPAAAPRRTQAMTYVLIASILFFLAGFILFLSSHRTKKEAASVYVTTEMVQEGAPSQSETELILNKLKSILRALNVNVGKEETDGN